MGQVVNSRFTSLSRHRFVWGRRRVGVPPWQREPQPGTGQGVALPCQPGRVPPFQAHLRSNLLEVPLEGEEVPAFLKPQALGSVEERVHHHDGVHRGEGLQREQRWGWSRLGGTDQSTEVAGKVPAVSPGLCKRHPCSWLLAMAQLQARAGKADAGTTGPAGTSRELSIDPG